MEKRTVTVKKMKKKIIYKKKNVLKSKLVISYVLFVSGHSRHTPLQLDFQTNRRNIDPITDKRNKLTLSFNPGSGIPGIQPPVSGFLPFTGNSNENPNSSSRRGRTRPIPDILPDANARYILNTFFVFNFDFSYLYVRHVLTYLLQLIREIAQLTKRSRAMQAQCFFHEFVKSVCQFHVICNIHRLVHEMNRAI